MQPEKELAGSGDVGLSREHGDREIGRVGHPREIDIPRGIEGHAGGCVIAVPAQVGRKEKRRTARVELGDERIAARARVTAGIDRPESGVCPQFRGKSVADDVDIAAGIERHGTRVFVAQAAEKG